MDEKDGWIDLSQLSVTLTLRGGGGGGGGVHLLPYDNTTRYNHLEDQMLKYLESYKVFWLINSVYFHSIFFGFTFQSECSLFLWHLLSAKIKKILLHHKTDIMCNLRKRSLCHLQPMYSIR